MADSAADTKKIWVTLPIEKAEILDVLAGDSPEKSRSTRKSYFIEKLIDEYLENHRERLKEDEVETWNKILDIKRKYTEKNTAHSKSTEDKIKAVDTFMKNLNIFFEKFKPILSNQYPDLDTIEKLQSFWDLTRSLQNFDDIDDFYTMIVDFQQSFKKKR